MIDILGLFTWLGYLTGASFLLFLFEKILYWAFDRKILTPIIVKAKWKWRALLTRKDPLDSTFEVQYSPMDRFNVNESKEIVDQALKAAQSESQGRIKLGTLSWDENDEGRGFIEADHIECNYPFNIEIKLIEDPDDLVERPDLSFHERNVEGFHFSINFRFPFHKLESTVQNIGVFSSFLETGLKSTQRGNLGPGQFVINPVESNLTLDEWIRNEGFDVSLLLADTGSNTGRTEVEFFPDRAEVHPPHLEIDSETTRYIRLMILEYYLKKSI